MAIATTKSQHIPTQAQADLYKSILPLLQGYAQNPGVVPTHGVAGLNQFQQRGEEEAMAGLRRIYQNDQNALGTLGGANDYSQQIQQRALGTQRPGAPASFLNNQPIDFQSQVSNMLGMQRPAPQTGGNSVGAMGPNPMQAPQGAGGGQAQPQPQPQQYVTPLSPESAPSYQQWQQMQAQGTQPQVTPQGVISQQPTSPQSVPYQSPLPTPPQPQNHNEQWWQDQYHAGQGIGVPQGYQAMPEAEQQAWMQKYGSDSVPYEHWQAFYQQQNPQQQQQQPQPQPAPQPMPQQQVQQPGAAMQRPQQSQGGYDPRTQNTQQDQMMQGVGGGVQGGPGPVQQQQGALQQGEGAPGGLPQAPNPFAGRTLATDPSRVQGGYDPNAMNRQDQYMQGTGGGVQGGPGGGVQAQAGGQPFSQQAGAPPPPPAPMQQQQMPQQAPQNPQGLTNPYINQASNAVLQPITEQFTNDVLPALRGSALQSGQFGGSRQAVGENRALNSYVDRAAQAVSPLAYSLYNTGLQGDIQGRLQGNQLGADYDRALLQQAGQSAAIAPNLAGTQHQIGVSGGLLPSQVYSAIGDQRRGITQQGLDSQYQQKLMQMGWPMTIAQNILGLTNAIPGGVSQVEQRYSE